MRILPLIAAASVALLVACGGDDDVTATPEADRDAGATPAASAPDSGADSGGSCELLTAADLAAAGLSGVSDPIPNDLASSDECGFDVDGGTVSVTYYTESEAVALGPNLYPDTEVLEGVGDEAWYVEGLRLAQVRLADGRVISIQDNTDTEDLEALLTALATAAAERG